MGLRDDLINSDLPVSECGKPIYGDILNGSVYGCTGPAGHDGRHGDSLGKMLIPHWVVVAVLGAVFVVFCLTLFVAAVFIGLS